MVAITAMASVYTLDFRRRLEGLKRFDPEQPVELRNALTDPDSGRQFAQRFAEHELFGRVILNLNPHDRLRAAVGAEWTYDRWGPAWGDNARKFRMGDGNNIISGEDSEAYGHALYNGVDPGNPTLIATRGFGQHVGSLLGELDARFHPRLSLLLSGRADKSSRSQFLLSPRVALVSRLGERQVVRLIWQRAERLNTAESLYQQQQIQKTLADPETLSGYEGIYSFLPTRELTFTVAGFYNALTVISWNVDEARTRPAGRLHLAGAELEAAYTSRRWRLGLNHSLVKQVRWRLAPDVTQSGVSYSHYDHPTQDDPTIVIPGAGNDLNNWSNHATKFFAHARLLPWLTVHLDARVFWGFPGARRGLEALEAAVANSDRREAVTASVAALRAEGAYRVDLRVNAGVQVALSPSVAVTLHALNIAGVGGFKRYAYDAGNVRAAPVRSQFLREPFTAGAKVTYSW
jgi:hypothetical protein